MVEIPERQKILHIIYSSSGKQIQRYFAFWGGLPTRHSGQRKHKKREVTLENLSSHLRDFKTCHQKLNRVLLLAIYTNSDEGLIPASPGYLIRAELKKL